MICPPQDAEQLDHGVQAARPHGVGRAAVLAATDVESLPTSVDSELTVLESEDVITPMESWVEWIEDCSDDMVGIRVASVHLKRRTNHVSGMRRPAEARRLRALRMVWPLMPAPLRSIQF